ncbi:acylphosphatase [Lactobacillus sp. DCY120]|uniref:acylphosphatase n=1 Tax=Bombilactobacillus apium TaxID=2675299 RepID=A0A850R4L2_9LACO|nr:acylphosphatase [Bombilactobacillus apium]NVY96911.1 acylphosphatase [Bombilactobacillus apium]
MIKHFSIDVYGQVQGVGFRYATYTYAQKYQILGGVENCNDGRVHIEAQGPATQLLTFLEIIKQGPTKWAQVTDVQVQSRPLATYTKFALS